MLLLGLVTIIHEIIFYIIMTGEKVGWMDGSSKHNADLLSYGMYMYF